MGGPEAGTGLPIPAEIIARLTEVAGQIADRSMDVRPTEAAAVATTQARALELLFHARIPNSEHRRVYVITMTGRFLPRGHGPRGGKIRPGTVRTVALDADSLRALDISTGDRDHRSLLPQLGPVSILSIPPGRVTN
jgi:hypothetical protein